MKKALFSVIIIVTAISCNDSRSIKAVRIGEQTWMAENLSSARFRNGDEIPEAKTTLEWIKLCNSGKPAWCYPGNDKENNSRYGKLYNWYAVTDPRGLAPEGWHVPTDEEWSELTQTLGGEVFAAYNLRATSGYNNQNSTTGFTGLPAGGCKADGSYFGFGSKGYWWTATAVNDELAWIRQLDYVQLSVNSLTYSKKCGLSIRCIKN